MENNNRDKAEREAMLLQKLQADFDKIDVETNFAPPDEKMPVAILRTLHEEYGFAAADVMGEFYFFPMPEGAPDIHYFTCMLSLMEELDGNHEQELCEAIAKLNFYLGCGAFALERDGDTLVYKLVTLISVNTSDEDALAQMNAAAAHAIQLPEKYTMILEKIAAGTASLDEFWGD